jgi:hypothetical protein
MAYDADLANRIRELLATHEGLTEMPMFGGLAFLLHGKMALAVASRGGLLVRVGPEAIDGALARPGASVARMGDRTMRGWVRVAGEGVTAKHDLSAWVQQGASFARSLPRKR